MVATSNGAVIPSSVARFRVPVAMCAAFVTMHYIAARRIRGMGSEGATVCGEAIAAPDRGSNAVDIQDACVSSVDTDNAAVTLTPSVTPSRDARARGGGNTDKPKSDIKK